MYSSNLSFYL